MTLREILEPEVWESKNVVTEEAPVDGEQHKVPGCLVSLRR